jgi:hypothetical protein
MKALLRKHSGENLFEKRLLPRPLSKYFYLLSGLPVSSARKPASQRVIGVLEGGLGETSCKKFPPDFLVLRIRITLGSVGR